MSTNKEIKFFLEEIKKPGTVTLCLQLLRIVEPNILPVTSEKLITDASFVALGWLLYKIFHTKENYYAFLDDKVKTSQLYADILKMYKELICNYADFCEMFSLNNTNYIQEFYKVTLYNGMLSYPKNFRYKIQGIHGYELNDIMGAKITTGYGVCRHISGFLTDLYKELGYEAYNASGIIVPTTIRNPIDIASFLFKTILEGKKTLGHAITLVIDNGRKVVYDPTNNTYSIDMNGNVIKTQDFNILLDIVYRYSSLSFHSERNEYTRVLKRETLRLTELDLLNARRNANYLFNNYYGEFFRFSVQNRELYRQLSESYDQLAGIRPRNKR